MIGKMVDNILKDSEEIYGDDELSGDDNNVNNKEPVFKIERIDNGQEMVMDGDDLDDGGPGVKYEDESNLFTQEEYDLANSVDMVVSKLSTFDEYKYFSESCK